VSTSTKRRKRVEANKEQSSFAVAEQLLKGDAQPNANSVVCGDSREILRSIPTETIHLIVTSPPYWNLADYGHERQIGQSSYPEYLADLLDVWRECERVLVPNGKLCINTPIVPVPKASNGEQHTRELKNLCNDIEATILRDTSLARFSLYVWQKQTTEKMFGSYPYPPNIYENNTIEFINVFVKAGKPRHIPNGVKEASRLTQKEWMDLTRQVWWIYPEDISRAGLHPAPFPELLPLRLVKMYTFGSVPERQFEGDIVLDPFGGTGTTAVAAKILGRRYISVDVSPRYTDFAIRRVQGSTENRTVDVCLKRLADSERALEALQSAMFER
jgi:DNA modification methylase